MAQTTTQLSGGRRRVVDVLKRLAPVTPAEIAAQLGVTEAAVRQHLDGLAAAGLATGAPRRGAARGRPAVAWSLTDLASDLFPDRHADLTVELLGSLRRALGDEGLERVIDERARTQLERYRTAMPVGATLRDRVEVLARTRTAEGYLAEVVEAPGGGFLLVEHHCPVCEAATACQGLCRTELELFREVLGPRVRVERTQHLLSGGNRCAYLVRPAATGTG